MKHIFFLIWFYIKTILRYGILLIVACFTFIPCLILSLLLPEKKRFKNHLLYTLLYWSYRGTLWASGLKIHISGQALIPSEQVIFAANHESSIDIPLLGAVIGKRRHLWFALIRFFSIPPLSYLLRRIAIPVDQDHPMRAARCLVKGLSLMRLHGLDAVIFPEGGRYLTGKIHAFFPGFAMLSKKLALPVVPVFIRNAGKIYPPGSFLLHPHPVYITIGEPMVCGTQETEAEYSERVRKWFCNERGKV